MGRIMFSYMQARLGDELKTNFSGDLDAMHAAYIRQIVDEEDPQRQQRLRERVIELVFDVVDPLLKLRDTDQQKGGFTNKLDDKRRDHGDDLPAH